VITTKKLFPLLAMNPKEHWSLVSNDNNQEVIPTSCNEPKRRWSFVSLVFSVCNQEDLLLKTVTNNRSLEKLFVRMEERKKIE